MHSTIDFLSKLKRRVVHSNRRFLLRLSQHSFGSFFSKLLSPFLRLYLSKMDIEIITNCEIKFEYNTLYNPYYINYINEYFEI